VLIPNLSATNTLAEMHILLTGSVGRVGSHTLLYLLSQGHTVLASDIVPLPDHLVKALQPHESAYTFEQCDVTDYEAFERIVRSAQPPIEGVIHLGAIPHPLNNDPRKVHNNNVVGSYNVLKTSIDCGIKRLVQASSVNAPSLTFPPEGHQRFPELPITENTPLLPEDPYSLSKAICEMQAAALCRYHPDVRIASLRFHMCVEDLAEAKRKAHRRDLWGYITYAACAEVCLKALESDGWHGAEVFYVVADEIAWEGGLGEHDRHTGEMTPSLELIKAHWEGRYGTLDETWWAENPRRSLWNTTKAKKMLGWSFEHRQNGFAH